MARRDQPYIPLYVQDYLTDEKLNRCGMAAQGLYIKIMCLLHKSEPYGGVLLKQKDKQNPSNLKNFACLFARLLPFTLEEIGPALEELVDEGVISIDGDFLYQKRMLKDGEISELRSKVGEKGGKKSAQKYGFGRAKDEANSEANSKQNAEYETENEIQNKEEGGEGGRPSAAPGYIIGDMAGVFTQVFPNGFIGPDEFIELRAIGGLILSWKNLPGDIIDPENKQPVLASWSEILNHCREDNHLSRYSIAQIRKHFSSIIQSCNAKRDIHKRVNNSSNRESSILEYRSRMREEGHGIKTDSPGVKR